MLQASLLVPALARIRDVEGVYGSFFSSADGRVLAQDFGRGLAAAAFDEVSRSLVSFNHALGELDSAESYALRFARHKLHVRRLGQGFICVLADTQVNLAALKLAVRLAGKEIEATVRSAVLSIARG